MLRWARAIAHRAMAHAQQRPAEVALRLAFVQARHVQHLSSECFAPSSRCCRPYYVLPRGVCDSAGSAAGRARVWSRLALHRRTPTETNTSGRYTLVVDFRASKLCGAVSAVFVSRFTVHAFALRLQNRCCNKRNRRVYSGCTSAGEGSIALGLAGRGGGRR